MIFILKYGIVFIFKKIIKYHYFNNEEKHGLNELYFERNSVIWMLDRFIIELSM